MVELTYQRVCIDKIDDIEMIEDSYLNFESAVKA